MWHRHAVARLLWCASGVGAGLGTALSVAAPPAAPFLLASLGGSAVFLFGLTRAPAAQPRALFGGHLGGAAVGVACYQAFGDAWWVAVLAQCVALCVMLLTRTVHPPAGANPLIMVFSHAGVATLWQPVFLGVATLAVVAGVWTRLYPGLVRYPASWFEPSPPRMSWGGWPDTDGR